MDDNGTVGKVKRVVIVGAGISGLAVATFLDGEPGVSLTVLEAAPEPGGNVRTDAEDGFLLDRAANGWLNNEPAMSRLLERAGLTEQVVSANDSAYGKRWIFAEGALHAAPMSPPAMIKTRLLPTSAKLRLALEPLIGRGDPEQTVGEFVRRRLGPSFVDRMVGPMVSGIYAADPDALELKAAFPRMAELEAEYRSLFVAMMKLRRGGAPRGHLETLRGGAGALTRALADRLGDRLRCGVTARSLTRDGDGWTVRTDDEVLYADAVVLAAPGYVQASLVRDVAPVAADALDGIPYAPVVVVATGWRRWEDAPEGFGALKALDADLGGVLGVLFSSNVFPEQAPEGGTLLRSVIGGAMYPEVANLDDQSLTRLALDAITAMVGRPPPPDLVRVSRHPRGIPQYAPGHRARVALVRVEEARNPGLYFGGNHLAGIGVKDCARVGEGIAKQILGSEA